MKRHIIASIVIAASTFLFIAASAFAAPTSTIVQNLVITGVKSAPCLTTDGNGLVASTTCGSGGSSSSTIVYGSPYIGVSASGTNGYIVTNLGVTTTQAVLNILSATGCLTYSTSTGVFGSTCVSTTTGNWLGTWQLKNPSDFAPSTTLPSTVNLTGSSTPNAIVTWLDANGNVYGTSSLYCFSNGDCSIGTSTDLSNTLGVQGTSLFNGTTSVGTTAAGQNAFIVAARGSNLVTSLATSSWSLGTNWYATGSSIINTSGSGSSQPSPALTIVAGDTYEVKMTIATGTQYASFTLGGTQGANLLSSFDVYVTAQTTGNLIISNLSGPLNISSISVQLLTNGNLTVDGGLTVNSGVSFANYVSFGNLTTIPTAPVVINAPACGASSDGLRIQRNNITSQYLAFNPCDNTGYNITANGAKPFFIKNTGTGDIPTSNGGVAIESNGNYGIAIDHLGNVNIGSSATTSYTLNDSGTFNVAGTSTLATTTATNLTLPNLPSAMLGTNASGTVVSSSLQLYVAASNAPANEKAIAQYTCSSTTDDTCIQSAITAASSTGGTITLSGGTFGYQVSGVATSVQEFYNNIVIQGQGAGVTNWTSTATSTPIIQIGTRQTGGSLLTNVGLTGINFTMGTGNSSVAAVKVDGLGNGSYIENTVVNYGGYCYQLEDLDRVLVFNNICNNPYIAGFYAEEGLENTYGNVNFQNDTTALSNGSTTAFLFGADADQGSPASFARITLLNDLFHSNNGVASTTGLQMTAPSRAMTVQNSLFESNTWQVNLGSEDHVDFIADQMTNNNTFSATSSVDCFKFNNLGGGNPWVTVQDSAFDNCVNGFHSYSGTYPWLTFLGTNKNDSNITNLFVGSWSSIQGQDTNFAGANILNLGLSTQPMANVYSQNITATGTITTGLTANKFVATDGSGNLTTTSTPSGGSGTATTTPFIAGQIVIASTTNSLSTVPYQNFWQPFEAGPVNQANVNLYKANVTILFGPVVLTQPVQANAVGWYTRNADASSTDKYDIGLYSWPSNTSTVATLVIDSGAKSQTSGGSDQAASSTQGTVTLAPGSYLIGITGSSSSIKVYGAGNHYWMLQNANGDGSVSSGGVLPATTSVPTSLSTPQDSPLPNINIFLR